MISIFNQFSFLFFVLPLVLFIMVLVWSERSRRRQFLALLLFLATIGGYLAVRPGSSQVEAAQVEAILAAANGDTSALQRPVFLETYSNY